MLYQKETKKYCNEQRERSELQLFEEVKFELQLARNWRTDRYKIVSIVIFPSR